MQPTESISPPTSASPHAQDADPALAGFRTALDRCIALHAATPATKLLRIPFKLAYSGVISKLARWRGTITEATAHVFWGDKLTVVLPETVSTSIYRYGFHEGALSRMLIEYLKPGQTFFDVGTHFGYFTCLASRLVGEHGQVHSFEPTRSTFKILSKNTASRPNVRANNVAVYARETTIPFNDFGLAFSAYNSLAGARLSEQEQAHLHPERYDVRAIALDDYVRETGTRPAFVKIDAESAEYDILQGMERTLAEVKPIVSVEVGDMDLPGVPGSSKVVQYLTARNYQPFEARGDRLVPHEVREQYQFDNLFFMPA